MGLSLSGQFNYILRQTLPIEQQILDNFHKNQPEFSSKTPHINTDLETIMYIGNWIRSDLGADLLAFSGARNRAEAGPAERRV